MCRGIQIDQQLQEYRLHFFRVKYSLGGANVVVVGVVVVVVVVDAAFDDAAVEGALVAAIIDVLVAVVVEVSVGGVTVKLPAVVGKLRVTHNTICKYIYSTYLYIHTV